MAVLLQHTFDPNKKPSILGSTRRTYLKVDRVRERHGLQHHREQKCCRGGQLPVRHASAVDEAKPTELPTSAKTGGA